MVPVDGCQTIVLCCYDGFMNDDEDEDMDDDGDGEDFDYDSFVEENFSSNLSSKTLSPIWRFVAIAMLVMLGLVFLLQIAELF